MSYAFDTFPSHHSSAQRCSAPAARIALSALETPAREGRGRDTTANSTGLSQLAAELSSGRSPTPSESGGAVRAIESSPVDKTNPEAAEGDPLGHEQGALEYFLASVPAESSASGDDAMARYVGRLARAHDVPDGSRGTGAAGEGSDVAVRRDPTRWDAPDCREDARRERGAHRAAAVGAPRAASVRAVRSTRPSARVIATPQRAASVGAISAGVVGSVYRPGVTPAPIKSSGTRWS